MKTRSLLTATAVSFALSLAVALPALVVPSHPAVAADKDKKVITNEKLRKVLVDIQNLLKDKKYQEAVPKVQEAEAIPNKNPYETFLTEEMGLVAYYNTKDYPNAARAIETAINSGEMPADELQTRTKQVTQLYYQIKNYAKAIEWGQKYVDQTKDPEIEAVIADSYYVQNDYKNASDAMNQALKYAEAKGVQPQELWLEVLLGADNKLSNGDAEVADLKQLVKYYPQPTYWDELLDFMAHKLKDNTKNSLDVYRLMLAAGTMKQSDEYSEMADIALREGYPGEAKAVFQKGIGAGVVARTGRDAQLIAKADQEADVDLRSLTKGAQEAAAQATGDAAVKFGEAYWGYGQYDKAVEMIQLGLKKGVKDKDDAELRLEIADLYTGNKADAQQALQAITPGSAPAQIGDLWMLLKGNTQAAAAQPAQSAQ